MSSRYKLRCLIWFPTIATPTVTKQSPKERWGGVHDCRGYIENYLELNHKHQLKTFVGIGFWWETPIDRKARQQLEQALIQRWKSPFNKECWKFWGKPFG